MQKDVQGHQERPPPVLKSLCGVGITHNVFPEGMELSIMAEDPVLI